MSPVRFWQKMIRCLRRREMPSPAASAPPAEVPPAEEASPVGPSRNAALDEVLQSAVERLLEDEALTADLVDPAARHLLDWGIARATAIVREAGASPAEAQARLAALRQQMRALARRVGEMLPEEQAAALQRLLTEEELWHDAPEP
ncbi:MAG: hypothetical protein J7575_03035 [Chloroflexi bacterium]|nr:hypothetical protein [Chloroflexota bacterium]